jgi:putative ATP-grasp target RiPP
MTLTPLPIVTGHDDPLATAAERVPLAWPRFSQQPHDDDAPRASVRPLGLRFAVTLPHKPVALPPWRYCPDRQIAVGEDGQPWFRTLVDMTMGSTGPSPDGGGSTGNEEWRPDFMSDETG